MCWIFTRVRQCLQKATEKHWAFPQRMTEASGECPLALSVSVPAPGERSWAQRQGWRTPNKSMKWGPDWSLCFCRFCTYQQGVEMPVGGKGEGRAARCHAPSLRHDLALPVYPAHCRRWPSFSKLTFRQTSSWDAILWIQWSLSPGTEGVKGRLGRGVQPGPRRAKASWPQEIRSVTGGCSTDLKSAVASKRTRKRLSAFPKVTA